MSLLPTGPPQPAETADRVTTDLLVDLGHAGLTRFLLDFGLDEVADSGSLRDRANAAARYMLRNPDAMTENRENISDAVVLRLLEDATRNVTNNAGFNFDLFRARHPDIQHALDRDGYTVEGGNRRTLAAA